MDKVLQDILHRMITARYGDEDGNCGPSDPEGAQSRANRALVDLARIMPPREYRAQVEEIIAHWEKVNKFQY